MRLQSTSRDRVLREVVQQIAEPSDFSITSAQTVLPLLNRPPSTTAFTQVETQHTYAAVTLSGTPQGSPATQTPSGAIVAVQ